MSQAQWPRLSLEDQVGQLVVAVWSGDWDRLAPLVARGRVGGVLLPAGAGPEAGELAPRLNRLQRLSTYPLLCAADLANPGLWDPGGPALGAARQPELARRSGELAGRLARAQGVHLLLGPTFDVLREAAGPGAGRACGENPSLVAELAAAWVAGCRRARALAVGRSFPGGGGAVYDAGRTLAALPQGRQTLEKMDLLPYQEALPAGLGAIATGHLHVAALDTLPTRLATHSSAVVEGLLRGTLGYDGLLLTDGLEAPEVGTRYAPGQAAVLALAAGHDLLVTTQPEEVYRALYEVLSHGDVPLARLEEAVRRIGRAKRWLGLFEDRCVPTPAEAPAVADLADELARAALVRVRGGWDLLAGRRALVVANRRVRADGSAMEGDLQRLAAGYLAQAAFRGLDPRPTPAQVDGVLTAAAGAGAALIFWGAPLEGEGPSQAAEALVALAQALKRMGLTVGAVVLGDPSALARFTAADLLLHLPGDGLPCLEAAFAYLLGHAGAPGRLPVSVRGLEARAGASIAQ